MVHCNAKGITTYTSSKHGARSSRRSFVILKMKPSLINVALTATAVALLALIAEAKAWDRTDETADFPSGPEKRAGFVGMRGRKRAFERLELEAGPHEDRFASPYEQLIKRAGFVGMRGKKSMPYESEDEESEMAPVAATKRAGFVGMRGKKAGGKGGASSLPSDALSAAKYYHKFDSWPYYLIPYASKSRRGNSGFVGMRG